MEDDMDCVVTLETGAGATKMEKMFTMIT